MVSVLAFNNQGSHLKSEKGSLTFVMAVANFAPKKSTAFEKKNLTGKRV